ncbi:hypothetical protein T4B_970 [Trichinella pseudospiralis]|uniref:Uncharacterized protein n=1 Tax=Trichinella pseudospiralis TaxID=6337 RepID=A0A0V1ENF8_TRIPS|nr:hypothetical protein T4A_12628 [Trichinella pseudospiralis]KRZ31146.1 hypothetical protein T4B_970 [Trichinella pseudospiralis]KRZ43373.1 hypothetical protein T4C_3613 [Trichinella pseudospiralis]
MAADIKKICLSMKLDKNKELLIVALTTISLYSCPTNIYTLGLSNDSDMADNASNQCKTVLLITHRNKDVGGPEWSNT